MLFPLHNSFSLQSNLMPGQDKRNLEELNPTLNANLTSDKLSLYEYVTVLPRSHAISFEI